MAVRGVFFQVLRDPRLVAAGWCVLAALVGSATAQPAAKGRPKQASPEVKKLDAKMEKVKDSFLKDTEQLIKSYEDSGSYDRARTILEALQKLYPQNEPIKEPEFFNALLRIWLGPSPADRLLKDALLGHAAPTPGSQMQ